MCLLQFSKLNLEQGVTVKILEQNKTSSPNAYDVTFELRGTRRMQITVWSIISKGIKTNHNIVSPGLLTH